MVRHHGYSATGPSKRTFWQSVPFELNRRDFRGRLRTADEVPSMSLANLQRVLHRRGYGGCACGRCRLAFMMRILSLHSDTFCLRVNRERTPKGANVPQQSVVSSSTQACSHPATGE